MNTKFTPGPWHVGMRSGHNAKTIFAYNGKDEFDDEGICEVNKVYLHTKTKDAAKCEGIYNAFLIAAAPELYDALKAAYLILCDTENINFESVEIMCQSAIAKAEGKK